MFLNAVLVVAARRCGEGIGPARDVLCDNSPNARMSRKKRSNSYLPSTDAQRNSYVCFYFQSINYSPSNH